MSKITPARLLWTLRRLVGPPCRGRIRLIGLATIADAPTEDIPPLIEGLIELGLARIDGGSLVATPLGESRAHGDFRGFAVWIDSTRPAVLEDPSSLAAAGACDDSAADRCRRPAHPDALPGPDRGDGAQGGAAACLARAARP